MTERSIPAYLKRVPDLFTTFVRPSETVVMMVFAVVVGICAGLGTIVFVAMIRFFKNLFFSGGEQALQFLGGAYVILLPMLGGLLVGPIVHFIAPEAKGHGVPEVLAAIVVRGGRIRPVVVLAKALGSAITIGSGGSVGREGPIVQIGAATGSSLAQLFKLSERRIINLVASGAAGGIAATFNAPIAGVMFALEVLLGELELRSFAGIVISAVTASVVSRIALGDSPAFVVPAYYLEKPTRTGTLSGTGHCGRTQRAGVYENPLLCGKSVRHMALSALSEAGRGRIGDWPPRFLYPSDFRDRI